MKVLILGTNENDDIIATKTAVVRALKNQNTTDVITDHDIKDISEVLLLKHVPQQQIDISLDEIKRRYQKLEEKTKKIQEKTKKTLSSQTIRQYKKIQNNDFCPCMSGKKYKKCCKQ